LRVTDLSGSTTIAACACFVVASIGPSLISFFLSPGKTAS
jgi:hypothetical protein